MSDKPSVAEAVRAYIALCDPDNPVTATEIEKAEASAEVDRAIERQLRRYCMDVEIIG